MRLLLDENLSPRLVESLADVFPGASHVCREGLRGMSDSAVWEYALRHRFIVVSKDDDFHHLAFLRGAPPKVIGLRLGNCTTEEIDAFLRKHAKAISTFGADQQDAYLELRRA